MFTDDDIAEFLFIPVFHIVLLLLLSLLFPSVLIQILLSHLLDHFEVMAEFAFPSLVAVPLFEELAENSFWIDAEGDFLYLDWLE